MGVRVRFGSGESSSGPRWPRRGRDGALGASVRTLMNWVRVGALTLGAGSCSESRESPERPPDIVVITLDSVRADFLTFRDPGTSPHLCALAEEGTIFDEAIAGTSWTLPTHAQLFTGQPPLIHGVQADDTAIDPLTPTLPEIFEDHGWRTHGVWTGWYLAADFGFGRGFESYRNGMTDGESLEQAFHATLQGQRVDAAWGAQVRREKLSHEDVNSERAIDLCIEAEESVADDEPLLLFAHLFDPHYDYVPPGDFATRFDPDYRGSIGGEDYWINPRIAHPITGERVINDRDLEHVRALYRGEIAWVDHQIGRLIEHLRESGRLENTILVVTSDHGEEFFEHGKRGHKQSLYEEVLRIPLLVVLPKALRNDPPSRVDTPVELSDILPTLLDYAGHEDPETIWGRSLRPALEGEPFEERGIFASLGLYNSDSQGNSTFWLHEVYRTRTEKLWRIRTIERGKPPALTFAGWFDLQRDRGELEGFGGQPSVLSRNPRTVAAWAAMEAHLAEMREFQSGLKRSTGSARASDLARVLGSELQGLGYVDASEEPLESPTNLLPWGFDVPPAVELPRH